MTERLSGTLSWWSDIDNGGFGYLRPAPPEGEVVVFRNELLHAGVKTPTVGMAFTFEHGVVRGGISGAVRVALADRPAPASPEPTVLAARPGSPAQAETKPAARGKLR